MPHGARAALPAFLRCKIMLNPIGGQYRKKMKKSRDRLSLFNNIRFIIGL